MLLDILTWVVIVFWAAYIAYCLYRAAVAGRGKDGLRERS